MKFSMITAALLLSASTSFAAGTHTLERTSPSPSWAGSTNVEVKQKGEYDPSKHYRGEMDRHGDVRVKNYSGDVLKGNVDHSGSGKVSDPYGNVFKVDGR